jgi:hypothetical protein
LQDYRPNIVGLLKRYNGFSGKVSPESKQVLDKIVDAYVALMSMAGFVEVSLLVLRFKHFADIYSTRRKARWAVGRMVSHRFLGVKFHGHIRMLRISLAHCFLRHLEESLKDMT